jgi:hypothetical protein
MLEKALTNDNFRNWIHELEKGSTFPEFPGFARSRIADLGMYYLTQLPPKMLAPFVE